MSLKSAIVNDLNIKMKSFIKKTLKNDKNDIVKNEGGTHNSAEGPLIQTKIWNNYIYIWEEW